MSVSGIESGIKQKKVEELSLDKSMKPETHQSLAGVLFLNNKKYYIIMNNITSFDSFNESNWIQGAINIKNKGALRKHFNKKSGDSIKMSEIESELDHLATKDKDPKKPGLQLSKKDRKLQKRLVLARTLRKLNENENLENYMFFRDIHVMKRIIDDMVEMIENDEMGIDSIISNGHNWILDHIAKSKENMEQVYDFLK